MEFRPSLLLLLALAALTSAAKVSYRGHQVLRIPTPTAAEVKTVYDLVEGHPEFKYSLWHDPRPGSFADIMTGEVQGLIRDLESAGLDHSVFIEDVGEMSENNEKLIQGRREIFEKEKKQGGRASEDYDLFNYNTLEDIYQYITDLAAEFPDDTELENIGQTFEGRDMWVLKICKGGCGNRPIMYIESGIHAREWITNAVSTFMIDRLLPNVPAGDEDLTEAFDWYFLPSVNPDGYSYTWTDDRYWRKTRHVIPGNACVGVDANRNFPVGFGLDSGSSGSSCSESYRGEEAFSELCAQNVRDFITPIADDIIYFQSLHAYSELIMYPWGYTHDDTVDAADQDRLGNIGNDALEAETGLSYEVGSVADTIYIATGITVDWAYSSDYMGIKYTYTNELRDQGLYGFELPPDQIDPSGREMYEFHAAIARDLMG